MHKAFYILLATSLCHLALARNNGGTVGVTPVSQIYPNNGGILFPGVPSAAGVNAASLARMQSDYVGQLSYTPALNTNEGDGYSVGFARANGNFGFGLGAAGTQFAGTSDHTAFVGIARAVDNIALGFSTRVEDLSVSPRAEVDFGLIVGGNSGIMGGLALYNVDQSARTAVAVGYDGGKYNVEGSLLLPLFSDLTGNYTVSVGGNVHATGLSLHFHTRFQTAQDIYEHTAAATVWFTDKYNLVIQFTSPSRWQLGLTAQF